MAGADRIPFRGTVYRHAAPQFTDIGPALLDGSCRVGGRFNAHGEFGVLYVSLDPDTTRAELRRRAGTARQEVGRAARRDGYEAIRYPSAAGAGENLAVFLDRLHPGSEVRRFSKLDLAGGRSQTV